MIPNAIEWVFALLILFQVKHFLADFVFQNVYMLRKGSPNWDFVVPLSIHAGIHALSTLPIVLYVNPSVWWLSVMDFFIHFVMDRIKAGPRYLGRFDDLNSKAYWVTFGADQMMHHLTHILIIWILVTHV
ncbi:MAG: hypothetical protein CL676_11910 [Bdellovibrionaceae bacterium]|nr:hypothetical protein [Pseudobdellovibrionaceae bacterium]|tara:strand:+ start:1386 stop:1775 length:390 start_codon:yes stop_codon:yes gene_type:complete